jgi:hypothetical protein
MLLLIMVITTTLTLQCTSHDWTMTNLLRNHEKLLMETVDVMSVDQRSPTMS